MDQLALLFVLLFGVIVVVPLGQRLGLPSPVLMTLFGVVLALLSFVPNTSIDPGLILPLVLPPLLYASVQRTSWRQFAANRRPILLLAVALVFVTMAVVAEVAHATVPGLPPAAAFTLGALVAPPDPCCRRPGTRSWPPAASRAPTRRSSTASCASWTSAACGDARGHADPVLYGCTGLPGPGPTSSGCGPPRAPRSGALSRPGAGAVLIRGSA